MPFFHCFTPLLRRFAMMRRWFPWWTVKNYWTLKLADYSPKKQQHPSSFGGCLTPKEKCQPAHSYVYLTALYKWMDETKDIPIASYKNMFFSARRMFQLYVYLRKCAYRISLNSILENQMFWHLRIGKVCLFQGFAAVVCLSPDRRVGICGDPHRSWHPSMNSLAGAYTTNPFPVMTTGISLCSNSTL